MAYINTDATFTFDNIPVGDYELNLDDSKIIIAPKFKVTEGKVLQVVSISDKIETEVKLTLVIA
jgi:hypothetical protein